MKLKFIIESVLRGEIGVMPTDTMYGLVGSAFNKKTIERIYDVRKRNKTKPLIILISSLDDLKKFGVKNIPIDFLNTIWPDKITVILPIKSNKFGYLHRGSYKLAFRLPAHKDLIYLIKKVGPIVAPSANIEGERPSKNIKEAQNYFETSVDFYIDNGNLPTKPSTIIEIIGNKDVFDVKLIRKGTIKI